MRWALLCLCFSRSAFAWESTCYVYPDPTLEASAYLGTSPPYCNPAAGPLTARNRWVGGLDEHRGLWEKTREFAGLPASVSSTLRLNVFTSSAPIQVGTQQLTSLQPVPFSQTTRVQTRAYSVGEMAQLPDWSYALWDWAGGNETCPLVGVTESSELCHDFASHMGPVNANHFVPQAQSFYARYHSLALGRAGECKAMAQQFGAARPRFDTYLKECELEALTLEAVGQHFLQDAWSMGHMWQRWGSPNLADFPAGTDQRDRAVLVALGAGLIHGSRGVLQRLPAWTSFDVNDALSAPHPDVQFQRDDGQLFKAIGDDYLSLLPPFAAAPEYQVQSDRLFSCAASGLLEVYQAAGSIHGAAAPLAKGLMTVDPIGPECFAQRATNASILVGEAVQLKTAGQQVSLTLDSRLVGWLVPKVARTQGQVPVSAKLRNQFRFDLQRIVSVSRLLAAQSPTGTELAEGRMGDFLGAKPNGSFDVSYAPYVDPPLPWPSSPDLSAPAQQRATTLARLFHRAHASDWCALTDNAALSALKAHASDLTLDATGKAAACSVCAELTVRHLRVGTDAANYDLTRAPLCDYLSPSAGHAYQPNTSANSAVLARAWCGCS